MAQGFLQIFEVSLIAMNNCFIGLQKTNETYKLFSP